MSNTETGDLILNLKDLLKYGYFSDLTICCGGREFKVHKNILYLQSSFFRQLLGGKFKEAAENHNRIELDDDPDALNVMLLYLYNFVYDDSCRKGNDLASFAVKVYALADKYDAKKLQSLAANKLQQMCDPTQNLKDFIDAVHAIELYTNPDDRALWDVVLPKIKSNIDYLLDKSEFRELIEDIPQLKFDLLALLGPAKSIKDMDIQKEEDVYRDFSDWSRRGPLPGRRPG